VTKASAALAVLGLALAAEACRAPAPAPRTRLVIALPVRPGVLPPLLSIAEATNTVFRHAYEPLTELSPTSGSRPASPSPGTAPTT